MEPGNRDDVRQLVFKRWSVNDLDLGIGERRRDKPRAGRTQNETATTGNNGTVHAHRAKFMHGPHPALRQMLTVDFKIHFEKYFGKLSGPLSCLRARCVFFTLPRVELLRIRFCHTVICSSNKPETPTSRYEHVASVSRVTCAADEERRRCFGDM